MKRFFKFLVAAYPLQLLLSIALLIFSGLLEAGMVVTFAPLVDLLTKPNLVGASAVTLRLLKWMESLGVSSTLVNVMIVMVTFTLLKNLFLILAKKSFINIEHGVLKSLTCDTYESFFNARWHFFSSNRQGVLGNSLIKEMGAISSGLSCFSRLVTNLFQVLFYFIISIYVSYKVSLVIACLGILIALPFLFLGPLMHKWGKQFTEISNKLFEIVLETLGAAKLIIGYGNQSKNVDLLRESVTINHSANIKIRLSSEATPLIYEPISFGVLMLSIYLAVSYFKTPVSEVVVVVYSFILALRLLVSSVNLRNKVKSLLPAFDQVTSLKELAERQRQPSGSRQFRRFYNDIVSKNVSFAYPGHKKVLHDINIVIPKGKMVAFVGESGVGKSTLIDLLLGFYEPCGGDILIDGTPLREFDILSWRHHLGYVPQDSVLFNMSVRENLLWSKEDASNEEIISACKLANADEFISKLKNGYDTIVGDRGIRLSGGQRQRIALARAILRQPDLLILDEATSALDSRSELLIQQAIEKIASQTTVVVIAHRLSTIVKADCIYVLDNNGYIVEKGTYEELMASKSKFSKLAKLQGLTPPASLLFSRNSSGTHHEQNQ